MKNVLDSMNTGENEHPITDFWCQPCAKLHAVEHIPALRRIDRCFLVSPSYIIHLLEWQKNKCPVCKTPLCLTKSKTWVVDHDHSCCPAGKFCDKCIRGILCGLCNRMLGLARDSVKTLERGAYYLKTWRSRQIPHAIPLVTLRPIYKVSDETLARLYANHSLEELGERYKCSAMTVLRRLKRSGIPTRPRGRFTITVSPQQP